MTDRLSTEVRGDVLEFLADEWPEAYHLDELNDRFEQYDRETIRLNLLQSGRLGKVTQNGGWEYRYVPGTELSKDEDYS